jgi:hypothetical protein
LAILGVTPQIETASYGTNTLIGWICPSVYSRDLRIRGVRDGKLVVSRCALDKHFASISGRWPAPHVCEQEMLDDDSGFGEITVEICTRALHTVRLANCGYGVMQTGAAREISEIQHSGKSESARVSAARTILEQALKQPTWKTCNNGWTLWSKR